MKKIIVLFLLASSSLCYAGSREAYAIGFVAGLGAQFIPVIQHKVTLPVAHAVQRAVKMTPEDRAKRKARKEAKQRHEQP